MKEPIVGIDLGTTNSEVAIVENGQVVVIAEKNLKIIPSFVGLTPDGQLLVGEPAKNQYLLYPEQTIKSIKRKMGSSEIIRLGNKALSPQEISAIILRKLKGMAENYLGKKVNKAVITVPAYFSDAQRQATVDAGEIAGLEVVRIINEPTAAALAYESNHKGAKKVIVYDLGGGTFDVSVVNIQNDVVEVLSSHGNNRLGGDDFDAKIAEELIQQFKELQGVDLGSSTKSMARIIRAAENAKIHLSDHPFAQIDEEYIYEKGGALLNLKTELSRLQYEEMIRPFIAETIEATRIALTGANLFASDIDEILLVGGSTRTPLVQHLLSQRFLLQPRQEVSPELCVAMGAAIQAAMIAGESVTAVLVDITPYTFGTSAIGNLDGMPYHDMFVPLIKKNSPIPVTKSDVFYTVADKQEAVEVKIYQGENPDALENIKIGNFTVWGLSPVPAGNEIVLQFDLDLDGILHVSAVEKATGLRKSIKIDNAISQFDEKKFAAAQKRVFSLFGESVPTAAVSGPEEDLDQVNALIQKAEAKLATLSGDDREDVINLIEDVKDAMNQKNTSALKQATAALGDLLFFLET